MEPFTKAVIHVPAGVSYLHVDLYPDSGFHPDSGLFQGGTNSGLHPDSGSSLSDCRQ